MKTAKAQEIESARDLASRFLTLPYNEMISVIYSLGLSSQEDEGLRDAEMFRNVFHRAKERNLVTKLRNAVIAAEKKL